MSFLRICTPVGIALAFIAPITSARAADASCDAVFAASDKTARTAHHAYVTVQLLKGFPPDNSEAIFVDAVAYDQAKGHWRRDPITAEKAQQMAAESRKQIVDRCRLVGDETLNSAAAVHYEMQAYDPQIGPTDARSQLWISADDGLLLRERIEMAKDSYADTRYEYANVHAPAGVQ